MNHSPDSAFDGALAGLLTVGSRYCHNQRKIICHAMTISPKVAGKIMKTSDIIVV